MYTICSIYFLFHVHYEDPQARECVLSISFHKYCIAGKTKDMALVNETLILSNEQNTRVSVLLFCLIFFLPHFQGEHSHFQVQLTYESRAPQEMSLEPGDLVQFLEEVENGHW